MARIRSIKPEFSTDGDNLRLSDSCALFFILLWNFCDDEGKKRLDLNQLVAELGGRWHQGKLKLFVSCLIKSGQLRLNSDSTWIQVTGWSHQRIDKPKQPEVKASELQWLSHEESKTALDDSRLFHARIGSRIGKERIGSDQDGVAESSRKTAKVVPAEKKRTPSVVAPDQNIGICVARYCELVKDRYGSSAQVRGKDAGLIKTLVKDFGTTKVIQFMEAYLQMPDAWFVTKRHDVVTMVNNLNAISQFIDTGKMFTQKEIKNLDNKLTMKSMLDKIDRGEL